MLDQPDKVADYNKRMDDTAKTVRDELAAYAALPALARERELYQAANVQLERYFAANKAMRDAVATGDGALAQQISDEQSRPARRELSLPPTPPTAPA
ncbi:hypothetical protein G6F40_016778 [Rhizopus arrhizus]|nr:hypothetical protein G6F40_016778 [Rhizopus arrhizus]